MSLTPVFRVMGTFVCYNVVVPVLFVLCVARGYSLRVLFFVFVWMPVCLFVCVEVLRPSQPSGVMSSAVSLPNHTFTGQA